MGIPMNMVHSWWFPIILNRDSIGKINMMTSVLFDGEFLGNFWSHLIWEWNRPTSTKHFMGRFHREGSLGCWPTHLHFGSTWRHADLPDLGGPTWWDLFQQNTWNVLRVTHTHSYIYIYIYTHMIRVMIYALLTGICFSKTLNMLAYMQLDLLEVQWLKAQSWASCSQQI